MPSQLDRPSGRAQGRSRRRRWRAFAPALNPADRRSKSPQLLSSNLRQRGLCLALDALEVRLVAEAFSIELVDVLGAGGTRSEPAIFGLDLDAAERLAV